VKAGLTPLDSIQAVSLLTRTRDEAGKRLETIEAAKRSDMIILDATPLDNISNIRNVCRNTGTSVRLR
jgi:hypothetical protein